MKYTTAGAFETFTLLQMFSIVDGRLATTMDDVYKVLTHIVGESLYNYHLPTARKWVIKTEPRWYKDIHSDLFDVLQKIGTRDFEPTIKHIKENLAEKTYEIPQNQYDTKTECLKYIFENNPLTKLNII